MATEGWPILARLMRVDQKTYLPDAMLTKVDRASMAFSLEVRVPLLDHRVVAFTAGIPDRLNYRVRGVPGFYPIITRQTAAHKVDRISVVRSILVTRT